MDEPAAAVAASATAGDKMAEPDAAAAKPVRPRRAPRKKAGGQRAKAEKPAKAEAPPPLPRARPGLPRRQATRARTRKKAE